MRLRRFLLKPRQHPHNVTIGVAIEEPNILPLPNTYGEDFIMTIHFLTIRNHQSTVFLEFSTNRHKLHLRPCIERFSKFLCLFR